MTSGSLFRRTSRVWVLLLVALLAGGGALWWLTQAAPDTKQAAPEPARPALTVSTTLPTRTTLPQRLSASGSIAAWQEASVGAESNGLRLDAVLVNVGAVVRRGEVLARFDPLSVQADLAQSRASLQEATAIAQEAQGNASRARNLSASGALSRQQVDQYNAAQQTAEARVAAAQAAVNAQQLRVTKAVVRAPDDGVISARYATVGAVVGAGTELFRMVRKGRLEWRAEVLASDLAQLTPGTPARVRAASGAVVDGTVRTTAPTVNPDTRKLLVYVDIPSMIDSAATGKSNNKIKAQPASPASGQASVLPGMFAEGEFLLGDSAALTVPQEAVVVRDGFSYVFAVPENRRVQLRKVQVGRRIGEKVEVLDGLDAQQPVAVQGAGFLNDGDLVRVGNSAEKFGQNQPPALTSQAPTAIK